MNPSLSKSPFYMANRGSIAVVLVVLIGVAIAAALFWWRPQPETAPLPAPEAPLVSVIIAKPEPYRLSVRTQGTVTPHRQINLVAEVAGRIVEVDDSFANGAFFNQDDTLVTLDVRDYQYRLTEAKAAVANAERELALERGQARQARRQWRDLGSREANALFLREPQVKAATAQLEAARAQQQQAQLNVERTRIKVPFNGRIQQTEVNLGQYVSAGSVIASIYDSSLADVRLPLTSEQVGRIGLPLGETLDIDQQPQVTLSATIAGQAHQWVGKLVRTEASIDSRTRFYFAVVEIPEPFNAQRYTSPLLIGSFVEAAIEGQLLNDVIKLPQKALFDRHLVFVVNAQEQLETREVRVVDKYNGNIWVSGDFMSGDRLVVSDPNVLKVGLSVSVKQ